MAEGPDSSILIRTPNWLGDTIMATPAITGVVNANSKSRISILTPSSLGELFSHDGRFHEVITFRHEETSGSFQGIVSLSKKLKGIGFHKFLIFPNSFSSALVAFLSGAPERIGYRTEFRRFLLTGSLRFGEAEKNAHRVLQYAKLAGLAGCAPDDGLPLRVDLPAEELSSIPELPPLFSGNCENPVGIAPSSYAQSRRWPVERFALLADRLSQELHAAIFILGSKRDVPAVENMMRLMKTTPVSVAGKTTLTHSAAILRSMKLLIANDSGLVHLASAIGTPYLVLFGAGNPSVTGPWHGRGRIIKKDFDCSPCVKQECKKDLECLKAISIDEVLEEARSIIRGNP